MNFEALYLGEFKNDKDSELQTIAKQYCEEVERHDKTICSLVDVEGYAKPANQSEMGLIDRNAAKVKKLYLDKYFGGVTNKDFNRAIKNYR